MNKNKTIVRVSGNDIGNNSTKTSEGVCCPSKVIKNDTLDKGSLAIKAKWRNEFYIIGDSKEAVTFNTDNKVTQPEYQVCLLVSIALSFPEDKINAITSIGVPYKKWVHLKDFYKEEILKLQNEEITIYADENDKIGVTKTINIVDCIVNAEGDISDFIGDDEIPCMVVDFGGGTLDITTYEKSRDFINGEAIDRIVVEGDTDKNFNFDDILNKIKIKLDSNGYDVRTTQQLISQLNQDIIKMFGREDIDLKSIKNLYIGDYARRVFQHMLNKNLSKYPNVKFIGGCAEVVLEQMERSKLVPINSIQVMPNSQFFNALNFKHQALKNIDYKKYEIASDEM